MTQTTKPRILTVHAFSKALIDAGIIPGDGTIRRFVIDVDANASAVVMYIEQWGDERLLDVALTLEGVEIRGVPAAEGKQPPRQELPDQ
jgi:hypothetical protein